MTVSWRSYSILNNFKVYSTDLCLRLNLSPVCLPECRGTDILCILELKDRIIDDELAHEEFQSVTALVVLLSFSTSSRYFHEAFLKWYDCSHTLHWSKQFLGSLFAPTDLVFWTEKDSHRGVWWNWSENLVFPFQS